MDGAALLLIAKSPHLTVAAAAPFPSASGSSSPKRKNPKEAVQHTAQQLCRKSRMMPNVDQSSSEVLL